MAAPAKRSSTDTQEKDLMLDKDMENDTWNFKSMTDDDPMDFGFDSPAKNKKNAFKLDMGFDLDGDFGSSFKMDMPDFDFSSPAKKTTKTKESSDDKPSGNSKQKKNPFAFSYDFDALDDFDLGSSPPKKGSKTTTKTMDCEEISASRKIDKSDDLDFGLDLPLTRQAPSKANTDVQAKPSAEKEIQNSKTTDTMVVNKSTHSNQAALESMGDFEAVESPQGSRKETSQTHTMCVQPQSVDTSPLKASCSMVEEMDEPCPSNETVAPSPLHASEIAHTAVNRETSPDIHELCRSGTKEDCPRDPENANKKMISTMESSYEKIEQTSPSISSQLCSDKIEHQQEEMSTDTQAEIQDNTKGALCDPDAGHSLTTLSGKISPGTPSQNAKVQDLSEKLPLDPSHSMPGLNNLRAMQNKDSGLIRSRFFKKPEKPESHVLESSPIQTKIQPVTRENIGSSLNPTNDRRHDIKDALPGSKTRSCPIELVNTDSAKNAANVNTSSSSHEKIIHKAHSNSKTVENVAGQMDHLKLQAKNTTREKSILQINISSKLDASSLTQKLSKHLSSGAESLQKPKMISLERPKLGNIMSDLRAVKTQRTIGGNKDQPSSAVQPEVSSSISKERNTEAPVKKSSEVHHLAPRDKIQIQHCPSSLKRKALDEDADRSLKPQLKRFSMSPRENRNIEELTHRAVQGKFSSQESRIDNSTTKEPVKESPQTKSHYQNINMANLEIPITENADNIEKAEAYTKELDNICNILKKKHEEAKELLVRAVVNNNKLLMLNHPLYEDQIRMVQKFAAKLTLRDT
ncbi:hypothetical protein ISN44_As12g023150 [Arabidopsis suecica]|uniref:Uncharacterized protein n=1 Tax=Arabidopsis suecica TaxID=45249 RepID=A0A8T1YM33_ARASU|nr:hypothetical protein ISN44_As12g023150 [Arabidopsis suecica]